MTQSDSMDTAPSIEVVFNAIKALYTGQDVSAKEKASVWLGEFQNSYALDESGELITCIDRTAFLSQPLPSTAVHELNHCTGRPSHILLNNSVHSTVYAWELSDKILCEKRDVESCYFAAQTMRSKIQYSFHELPEASYISLRDSLRQHLSSCDENVSHAIVTQLVLALADLYLQVSIWNVPVFELIGQFNSSPSQIYILLELLTMLAEEANSRRLRIGANRRQQLRDEFSSQAQITLEFLSQTIDKFHENAMLVCHVFKCLAAWLSLSAISTVSLANSVLLDRLFQVLANLNSPKNLHDSATDCVVQALYLIEDTKNHLELGMTAFSRVHDLQTVYQLAVAHDDSEKMQNFCRIFTELGESLLTTMVNNPEEPLGNPRTLDLLLDCAGHYDYSLAEITFNVWYRLSELIYQKDSLQVNVTFTPYIKRLVQVLYKHCQFDSDFDGTPAENEEISEFRRKLTEVIKDVVFIVGSSNFFKEMYAILQTRTHPSNWDEVEAALFMMSVVAKNVMPDDEEMVTDLLENLAALPDSSHVAILYSSVALIGQLSDWFSYNVISLKKTVHFLVKCLKNAKLAPIAASSLESVCSSAAREHMTEYVGDFLQLCVNIEEYQTLPNEAILCLLRSTSALISFSSAEDIGEKLKTLCIRQSQPLIQILTETANNQNSTDKENLVIKDPVIWLDRLSAVFRNLAPVSLNGKPTICASVVTELLPVVLHTCEKYETNARVVEHACKTLRFMIRCMGTRILPLLTPLVEKMFTIYQRHPHSCFLYLGSVLVDEYGLLDDFVPGLIQMLKAFVGAAFNFLEQPGAMQCCPDSVDDLFRLSLRFVQKAPAAFFTCEVCRPLFQCALAACTVDHRDASLSVQRFLIDSIEFSRHCRQKVINTPFAQSADHVIHEIGEPLVNSLLHASIFCLSSPVIRGVADLISALIRFDNDAFSLWLGKALKTLPQKGTLTATPAQLEEFHAAVTKSAPQLPGQNFYDMHACHLAGVSNVNLEQPSLHRPKTPGLSPRH